MAVGKNLNDKSDPAACIYQVFTKSDPAACIYQVLKTGKQKLFEIYFFGINGDPCSFLITSQSLKAIVNRIKILKMLTAVKIKKRKSKAIKYTPGQHCFKKHLN